MDWLLLDPETTAFAFETMEENHPPPEELFSVGFSTACAWWAVEEEVVEGNSAVGLEVWEDAAATDVDVAGVDEETLDFRAGIAGGIGNAADDAAARDAFGFEIGVAGAGLEGRRGGICVLSGVMGIVL